MTDNSALRLHEDLANAVPPAPPAPDRAQRARAIAVRRRRRRNAAGAALAVIAIAAVPTAVALHGRDNSSRGGVTAASGVNTSESPTPKAADSSEHLTLSDVANLTGFEVQASPGMIATVDSATAMRKVPEADYVVGAAKLGLSLDTGVTGSTKYEWHDVWVVVTKTQDISQTLLAQGTRGDQSEASSSSDSGTVSIRTIVFVDAKTGGIIRSVTP